MFSHISLFWSSDFFVSLIICIWFTACMLLIFKQIIVLQCHFVTLSVRTQYSKITPAAHLQVARSISRVLISSWHLWKTWQLAPAALVCNYFLVTETNLFCPPPLSLRKRNISFTCPGYVGKQWHLCYNIGLFVPNEMTWIHSCCLKRIMIQG